MTDQMNDGKSQTLEAEKENGAYLLAIKSVPKLGYTVESETDTAYVKSIKIHGHYIGTSDCFAVECADFEITDDRVLNLYYGGTEVSQDEDND